MNRSVAFVIHAFTLFGGVDGALVSRDIAPSYAATATLLVGGLDRPELAAVFETSATGAAIYGGLIRSETVLDPLIDQPPPPHHRLAHRSAGAEAARPRRIGCERRPDHLSHRVRRIVGTVREIRSAACVRSETPC